MKRLITLLSLSAFSLVTYSNIIYVNLTSVSGNNDGTSWADAYTNPWTTITNASAGDSIFIAQGTFYSNTPTAIPAYVSIFGGFPMSGNPTWADRDWEMYPTIFSGDQGQNDVPGDFSSRVDNAVRVFTSDTKYEINGLIIENGGNDGGGTGCGLAQGGASSREGIIRNCIFRNNLSSNAGTLSGQGGALRGVSWSINDTLIIENTLFENNHALEGGAIYSQGTLILNNCKIVKNTASRGAAICANNSAFDAHIIANNNLFLMNNQSPVALYEGAAVLHIYTDFQSNDILTEFTNCSFISNHATTGSYKADIAAVYGGASSNFIDLTYINCLFNSPGFTAPTNENFSTGSNSYLNFYNCITDLDSSTFYGGISPSISTSNFEYAQTYAWSIEDNSNEYIYQLDCNSPGIDQGENTYYFGPSTDLNGNPRFSGTYIDLGAFETQFFAAPIIINTAGTLSTSVTYDSYQWYLDGSAITGATNPTYTTTQDGDYYLVASFNNDCMISNTSNTVSVGSGTNGIQTKNIGQLQLFPNPSNGIVTIQTDGIIQSIEVSTINGKVLYMANQTINQLNLNSFENGIYLVKVETENGTFVSKLIKQ